MRAHLVQLDIQWEDRHANYQATTDLLAHAPVSPHDLIILPELFDSGFSLNTSRTADNDLSTHHFLSTLARSHHAYVQGGRTVLNAPDSLALNLMSIYNPSGQKIAEYAKIHPFTFGREPEAFAPGHEIVTYNAAHNLTVAPIICYDLRFPELFRIAMQRGAHIFAIGANWPNTRQQHWRTLAIARAIENQAFVLAVNRTGSDPHLAYSGGSIAVDPQGRIIAELDDQHAVLSVDIDPHILHDWRTRFPAWKDIRLLPPHSA